ncbi:MAG: aminoacyl-tRNA hydrolase [Patescibacteria group bacterium]
MKLIIGLGNPEPEYQTTRHNTGFLVIDKLLADCGAETKFDKKNNADIAKGEINKKRVLLAKPQTHMNNSGVAVRALLDFYKLKPANLIVIHDDKDIALGETRVQTDRGPAGHNGVKSIIEHLGTQNFTRIRVGVAPTDPSKIKDTGNFVLGKFTAEERKKLKKVIENITKEIESLV